MALFLLLRRERMFTKGSYGPSMDRLPCESADDREPLLPLEPSVLLEKPQV